jgi:hypothetical protein
MDSLSFDHRVPPGINVNAINFFVMILWQNNLECLFPARIFSFQPSLVGDKCSSLFCLSKDKDNEKIQLFSLSLTRQANKLECSFLDSIFSFQPSVMFVIEDKV